MSRRRRKAPKRVGGKIPSADVAERLAWTEQQLGQLVPYRTLKKAFAKKFHTSTRTGAKYIERVRAQWAREVSPVDRAAKREEIERSVKEAFRVALKGKNPRAMVAALELQARLFALFTSDEQLENDDIEVVFSVRPDGTAPPKGPLSVDPDAGAVGDPAGRRAVPGPGRGAPLG